MAFSFETVRLAWVRAGAKCECQRKTCGHSGRCNQSLHWDKRNIECENGWEAHHRTALTSDGGDELSNCEILCISCHKNTGSYGRP